MAVADYDGDGWPDLAICSFDEDIMSVLFNNGDGTFGGRTDYPVSGDSWAIHSDDFNGDGWPDIVTTSGSVLGDRLYIFLNDGTGIFTSENFQIDDFPQRFASIDYNRDGAIDIVALMSPVTVFLNDGGGNFETAEVLGPRGNGDSLLVADFNGDGIDDLLMPGYRLYFGKASGGLEEDPVAVFNYSGVAGHGDFNGDGFRDLVFSDGPALFVHHGDGTGSFHTRRQLGNDSTPHDLLSGDFNNDGRIDLAVVVPLSSVGVLINISSPSPEIDLNGLLPGTSVSAVLNEEDGPSAIAPGLFVDDDSGVLHWARVKISATAVRFPVLTSEGGEGLTICYDAGTATLDITGEAPVEVYQAALRSVAFESLDSPAEPFEVVFTIHDSVTSASATAEVTVARIGEAAEYVVTTLADPGEGGSSSPGVLSLREAVAAANADPGAEAITFAEDLAGVIELTAPLPLLEERTLIRGPGADRLTVRLADGLGGRIFAVGDGATVAVTDLTLSGGDVEGQGGAIFNAGLLSIDRCHLTGSRAREGGAIASTGILSVRNSTFSGNLAEWGGAIYHAAAFDSVPAEIVNVTLSGNSAEVGGGLYNASGTVRIESVTITENSAPAGAGVASRGVEGVLTKIRNTIVSGNTGPDIDRVDGVVEVYESDGYNLIGDGNALDAFAAATDLPGLIDPGLRLLWNNGGPTPTHAPHIDSPVLGAGNTAISYDQRGVPRPQGDEDDIGSVEAEPGLISESLVVTTADDENDGTSAPIIGSGTSLREAILYANTRDAPSTITFAPSVGQTITITTPLPVLAADIEIRGPAADRLIITCERVPSLEFRLFSVAAGTTCAIRDVTLAGGYARTLDVPENVGGAIWNAGDLTVSDCVITGNDGDSGAGIFNDVGGNLTVLRSTLNNNGLAAGSLAGSTGGGIQNLGTALVQESTISGNRGYMGGGISNGGTLTLVNSTVSGNTASIGAGILNGGYLTITGSTITKNTDGSSTAGAGIVTYASSTESVLTTVENSIIAGNTGTDVDRLFGTAAVFASNGHNLIGEGNATDAFNAVQDQTGVDPKLGPLQFNGGPTKTHHPLPDSPAINRGKASFSSDQRGVSRPKGAWPDIGAVEAGVPQSGPNYLVNTLADLDLADSAFSSLRGAIAAANANPGASTITFATDVYGEIELATPLPALDSEMKITGPGVEELVIRPAAGNEFRVFHVAPAGDVFLSGLTVSGGTAPGTEFADGGGGILNEGTLALSRVAVRGNRAAFGGGIANLGGTAVVTESTVAENEAEGGGGIVNLHGTLQVVGSAILKNSATGGGGGILTVAQDEGNVSEVTVVNSTFAGNTVSAPDTFGFFGGGAISNFNLLPELLHAHLTIIQSTFVGNAQTNGLGGAIYNAYGQMEIVNSLLVGNLSRRRNEDSPSSDAAAQVFSEPAMAPAGSMIGLPNGFELDDIVGPVGDYGGSTWTIPLVAGSPAVDGGETALIPDLATDQRGDGFGRVEGAAVDIGAYELFAPPQVDHSMIGGLIAGEGPIDLAGAVGASPAGGTFSGTGVDAEAGLFDPAGLALGDYTITYTVMDEFGVSNHATFTVTISAIDFENWRLDHFTGAELLDSTVSGALGDADLDSVTNLIEFAFGTDPKNPVSGPSPLTYVGGLAGGGSLGETGAPLPVFESSPPGEIRALFIRRAPEVTDGLTYTPRFSADLLTWEDAATTPAVLTTDGVFEVVSLPFPVLDDGRKASFFRIEIDNNIE